MKQTFIAIFSIWCVLTIAPLAQSQVAPNEPAVLNNTTLGQSQNDQRDLANSLIAGPQKFGKGEKKAQINAGELKSKSIKDATFGGSLLNTGIAGAEPKLDASKERAAPSEEKTSTRTVSTEPMSSPSPQAAPTERVPTGTNQPRVSESGFSFSSLSQTATLADELGETGAAAAPATTSKASNSNASHDPQNTDQSGAEKPPSSTTEKPSGH